jgi:hypothetical protein
MNCTGSFGRFHAAPLWGQREASSNIAKHEDDDTTKRMPTTNEKAVAVGQQESKDRSDTS